MEADTWGGSAAVTAARSSDHLGPELSERSTQTALSSPLPVSAAVVGYNTSEYVTRCVDSLRDEPLAETIVIDNASSDGTSAVVARAFPGVTIIANAQNAGYGAALNQALRVATTPYVLLLNADTEVRPHAVAELHWYLASHPSVAIAGPRLEDRHGLQRSCFPFPGTARWLFENKPLSPLTARIPYARERSVSFRTTPGSGRVPWVLGAAMLVRRDALLRVGGFDESYFMYYEEVDLCRRLANAGWETHYVPSAIVMHVGAASTSQEPIAMRIQRFQSAMRYYGRHQSGMQRWLWQTLVRLKCAALLSADTAPMFGARDPGSRALRRARRRALLAIMRARVGRAVLAPTINPAGPGSLTVPPETAAADSPRERE